GYDTIYNFDLSQAKFVLLPFFVGQDLDFGSLEFSDTNQGTEIIGNGDLLAVVVGVQASQIDNPDLFRDSILLFE
ncbi:hypothetical protein, partial [Moorena sp. SIO4A5]